MSEILETAVRIWLALLMAVAVVTALVLGIWAADESTGWVVLILAAWFLVVLPVSVMSVVWLLGMFDDFADGVRQIDALTGGHR